MQVFHRCGRFSRTRYPCGASARVAPLAVAPRGGDCGRRHYVNKALLPYDELPHRLPRGATIRYPSYRRAHIVDAADEPAFRGVSIAVIGASGNTGREIVNAIVSKRNRFLGLGEMTVQLVGSREGTSLGTMIGHCTELRDAYDDLGPQLEIVCDIDAVKADFIVFAVGASLSQKYKTFPELARANMDVFDSYAEGLKQHNKKSIIIVVSNPSEFAVDTFVQAGFDRRRVLGFGSYLDTMRFRREVASELGVSRQSVTGFVLGKHGLDSVPCWSTASLAPHCTEGAHEKLEKMKAEGLARVPRDVHELRALSHKIRNLAQSGEALEATSLVSAQPADVRATLRKYVSNFSGPMYPRVGIGEKVSQLALRLVEGRTILTSAQIHVKEEDDFLGLKDHAIGAPVMLSCHGAQVAPVKLTDNEVEAVRSSAEQAKNLAIAVKGIKHMRQKLKNRKK